MRLAEAIRRRPLAISAIAGVAAGAGHVPFSLVWLAVPALACVMVLGALAPDRRAAGWRGFFAGFGYALASVFWIVEPFLVDVARHGWMAPFALALMAAGFGLFWAAGFWLARLLVPERGAAAFVALPLGLTASEFARGYLFSGFPWGLVSYVWVNTPVLQLSAWVGPYGLGLATLAAASAMAYGVWQRRALPAVLALLGVAAAVAAGQWRLAQPEPAAGERPVVRLIQPNADQRQKWDPEMMPVFFERQLKFTAAPSDPRPDLIVWPEVAVPFLLNDPTAPLARISGAAGTSAVAVGGQSFIDGKAYNSLAVLGPDGTVAQRYDKHHLVPFGEYLPGQNLLARVGLAPLAARFGIGYTPGPGPRLLDFGHLGKALPLICYEAIFPQEIRRAPSRPDWLLQVTNDAWFGKTAGPFQSFAQSRARSVEFALPMVRVANTGISAVIDAKGRVVASLKLGEAGWLDVKLPAALPATFYARTGDGPTLAAVIVSALLLLRRRQAKRIDAADAGG